MGGLLIKRLNQSQLMKKLICSSLILIAVFSLQGCSNTGPNTKTGAVAGGAIGALVGGVIGYQSGHGLEGAAIGAGTGAVAGGLLGSAKDDREGQ